MLLTLKVYLDQSAKAKEEYQVKLAEYRASIAMSVSISIPFKLSLLFFITPMFEGMECNIICHRS